MPKVDNTALTTEPSTEDDNHRRGSKTHNDWGDILRLCRMGLGARAHEVMCRLLSGMIGPGGAIACGEVTQFELRNLLEQKLRSENLDQFQGAEWKITRNFFNRLVASGSLQDSARKPIGPDDSSMDVSFVDRNFEDLIVESVLLAIARGEPDGQSRTFSRSPGTANALAHLVYGDGSARATHRIQAALGRLVTKNFLTADHDGKLHYRHPPRLAADVQTTD